MCITPLEYTPVSRSQIFSLTGEYTTDDICKGVKCETVRAQVRTSVQQRDDGSTFGGSPLEDLFYNSNDYQFYCFIDLLRAVLFQAFAESIIRGLGQYFHTAEVPG